MKVHRLDWTKNSLHCNYGTKCGIMLKPGGGGKHFAARVGTAEFTQERLAVQGSSVKVTCRRCRGK